MSRTTEQKIRLLALYDLLQSQTDETHPMTTQEIITALAEKNISVSRKTLYQDFELLNKYGYEVICNRASSNQYYVVNRRFERPEVQVLLSAVGASQLLSDKKTASLVQKLLELLGVGEAEQLQSLLQNSLNKHSNEKIYYNIDTLVIALTEKKKASFLYFDYATGGNRVYRKDKKRYIVSPLGLAYSDDKLYLICYSDKHPTPANYRVDRMDEVRIELEAVTKIKELENFDLNAYRQEQFSMLRGETENIELLFPQDLMEAAIDRFGEGIIPIGDGCGNYIIKAKVQVSKNFFAWLAGFEGRVKIQSPKTVKVQYSAFIKNLNENL